MKASVIIPAYYSSGVIAGCLDALHAQTVKDFEVIVVSSSPEAETERVVRACAPEAVFVQSPHRLLPHGARNRGIELATSDRLVSTDPDCRARPDWLERLLSAVTSERMIVGGSVEQTSTRWSVRAIHRCKYPHSAAKSPAGPRAILPTANVCFPRRAFEEVGPFDGDLFCGDALICDRAHALGLPVVFEPLAVVDHEGAPSFTAFLRERAFRGREFAAVRARRDGWSAGRGALMALAGPARFAKILGKTAASAHRAGLLEDYVKTLPIEVAGQAAWIAGETFGFTALARSADRWNA